MGNFSFLSDSDDEKAVDELLSQAMDQSVLEQVAAVNCSGFTDSALPTHLEVRFQKLKSFPSAIPKSKPSIQSQSHPAFSSVFKSSNEDNPISKSDSTDEGGSKGISEAGGGSNPSKSLSYSSKDDIFSHSDLEKGLKGNSVDGFCSEPTKLDEFSAEDDIFSFSKKIPSGKKGRELKSPSSSSSFPSDSSAESLSPPQKSGCLWCSPKKSSRKKNKENRVLNVGLDWGKNDEILSDVNSFSGKAQQKLLKKVTKEEEKISREAEKIVKWAKQASARMEVYSIEDELSDKESLK